MQVRKRWRDQDVLLLEVAVHDRVMRVAVDHVLEGLEDALEDDRHIASDLADTVLGLLRPHCPDPKQPERVVRWPACPCKSAM